MDYFDYKLKDDEIRNISSIGLAHLGDSVFELLVRSHLCYLGKATGKNLHRATIEIVCAENQAKLMDKVMDRLTEKELSVFKRGRNANVHSVPSHATRAQYAQATGLEALFGYLYLQNQKQRINELFNAMMEDSCL